MVRVARTDLAGSSRGSRRLVSLLPALGIAALLAAVIGLAFGTGLVSHVGDQERLEGTVEAAGLWGPVLFVTLMVLLVPLNVPGLVFVVPATSLFGMAGGIVLSLLGGFLASVIGMVLARRFGRRALEPRIPPRLRRWEARLVRRGFWAVVLLRTCTFLFQPVDWICGLSGIPLRTAVAGTFVGLIPPTVVIALSGGGILDALR